MNSRAVIQFEKAGFAVFPNIPDEDEVCEISRQLVLLGTANAGTRRLLNEPWCLGLGQRLVRDIRLSNLMPHDACAVQCTYFTNYRKRPVANYHRVSKVQGRSRCRLGQAQCLRPKRRSAELNRNVLETRPVAPSRKWHRMRSFTLTF
jgi:hypothetical protein